MTRDRALALLIAANPRASRTVLEVYVDAYLEYSAAQANITAHGAMVMHPRTGAPIENPFGAIRDRARSAMIRHDRIVATDLWDESRGSVGDHRDAVKNKSP